MNYFTIPNQHQKNTFNNLTSILKIKNKRSNTNFFALNKYNQIITEKKINTYLKKLTFVQPQNNNLLNFLNFKKLDKYRNKHYFLRKKRINQKIFNFFNQSVNYDEENDRTKNLKFFKIKKKIR